MKFRLVSDEVRRHAARQVLAAPLGKVVEIKDPTRSLDANARFHAMLTDVSRQAEYMGKRRSTEFWKALFVSAWSVATGRNPDIAPGLEGEAIVIRESTATMSGRKLSEVMEYIEAYCAMNGIKLSAREE